MAACFLDRDEDTRENVFPSVIPNWDHTPRSGREGWIVTDSTPELFGKHLREAVEMVRGKAPEHRVILLKSWNEWAEGNYVEPDLKWGRGYLEVMNFPLSVPVVRLSVERVCFVAGFLLYS